MAIIAILAAIAAPNFLEAQVRAKTARVRNDLRTIVTAIEAYAVDESKYPVAFYAEQVAAPYSAQRSCCQFIPGGIHFYGLRREVVAAGL